MAAFLIHIDSSQRIVLKFLIQKENYDRRIRMRTLIILLSAAGESRRDISGLLKINLCVVTKWKKRFIAYGVNGLFDKPRPGRPRKYDEHSENRILTLLNQQPPSGYSRCNRFLIVKHLNDVSAHQVWLVMKKYKVILADRQMSNLVKNGKN